MQHLPPEVLPEGADAEAPVASARSRALQDKAIARWPGQQQQQQRGRTNTCPVNISRQW